MFKNNLIFFICLSVVNCIAMDSKKPQELQKVFIVLKDAQQISKEKIEQGINHILLHLPDSDQHVTIESKLGLLEFFIPQTMNSFQFMELCSMHLPAHIISTPEYHKKMIVEYRTLQREHKKIKQENKKLITILKKSPRLQRKKRNTRVRRAYSESKIFPLSK